MPKSTFFSKKKEEKKFIVTLTICRKCNLRCRYCYEPHEHFDGRTMDFKVAQEIITRYMEAENEYDNVEFQLFGGEPMLAFPLIKQIVEWFHSRSWNKGHIFFITTNGTILTEEMKKWLLQNRQCVVAGFSIDGNRLAHNLGRDNSYDLLRRNIPFFRETWPTQPAKMTIYAETIPYIADSIIELEEMGLYFTANIVFEDIWGEPERKKALLDIYREQLLRLVDYYVDHPHLEPVGPLLRRELEFTNHYKPLKYLDSYCVRYCGAGHEMVMVDVDGSIYPCHRFAPWIAKRPAPGLPPNRQKKWMPEKCTECKYVSLCPTCAGFNWESNGDTGIRTTYHCEAFKLELLASARLQAIRLGQRPLSDLTKLSNEEAVKVKRRIDTILELAEKGI